MAACRLKEGSVFYYAPNDKRTAFKNIGTTPATYHVIKVISARTHRSRRRPEG